MKKDWPVKAIAIITMFWVIAAMVMFPLKIISVKLFWIILILCAAVAYFLIPKLKKH